MRVQSIVENVDQSQFYLVEHVFENAIQDFCRNANIHQIDTVNKYVNLIHEGKMSKQIEKQLSEHLEPYLEEYVEIYTPYLFQGIEESKADFTFAEYRNKVGKDAVLKMFEDDTPQASDLVSNAAVSAWNVSGSDSLKQAISKILSTTGLSIGDIIPWIKATFQDADTPDSAVETIVSTSNKSADEIKNIVSNAQPKSDDLSDKFDTALNGGDDGDDESDEDGETEIKIKVHGNDDSDE